MAEWQYLIHRVDLGSGPDFDQQLSETLVEFGRRGWELAELLPDQEKPGAYRLILKSPKPMD